MMIREVDEQREEIHLTNSEKSDNILPQLNTLRLMLIFQTNLAHHIVVTKGFYILSWQF